MTKPRKIELVSQDYQPSKSEVEEPTVKVLGRRTVKVKPRDYQPSRAEKEQEFDMPGASEEAVRKAFFRPVEWESK